MRLAKRLIGRRFVADAHSFASFPHLSKATINGVLNLSVMDGWWYEGYREGAGWALPAEKVYENQTFQDELDAFTIYSMLENEIIPLYYAYNSNGYSHEWIQYIKKSVAEIAPHFTTKRMLDEYYDKFYFKLANRSGNYVPTTMLKQKKLWHGRKIWRQLG